MSEVGIAEFIPWLQRLTGQVVPESFRPQIQRLQGLDLFGGGGIGHRQLNELLLTLGYDRVTRAFFDYVFRAEGAAEPVEPAGVKNLDEFASGIRRFRKHAMLLYGNVKFGFKRLSRMTHNELTHELRHLQPIARESYHQRPDPVHVLHPIEPQEAYYLGYIVERQLKERLARNADDRDAQTRLQALSDVRRRGRDNHDAYLTYDHMDVYIATSMRERHEFVLVRGFIQALFSHPSISDLKLRWFDPTQAYCPDRIDKGLVEALMVKRARCTIYHVQEADTLGKDSELAATLAQGKPVVAYVPKLSNLAEFKRGARKLAEELEPGVPFDQVVRDFLKRFYPHGAWEDPAIRGWLSNAESFDTERALDIVLQRAQEMYDKRAGTLSDDHPLALQVSLSTGVANGVLVVRSVDQCARLLERIMLNALEFDIEERETDRGISLYLRERITGCVFRVVTGDELLTNSFWNFYLRE